MDTDVVPIHRAYNQATKPSSSRKKTNWGSGKLSRGCSGLEISRGVVFHSRSSALKQLPPQSRSTWKHLLWGSPLGFSSPTLWKERTLPTHPYRQGTRPKSKVETLDCVVRNRWLGLPWQSRGYESTSQYGCLVSLRTRDWTWALDRESSES